MLQRIQTIWLLLASVCAFLGFKLSFYSGTVTENETLNTFKKINATTSIPLIIVTTAIAVLALITIFLYNNRTLQLRLSIAGILLEALLLFLYYAQLKPFTAGSLSLTALLQGCVVLFFILAAKGISNDEKIIKESNRLR
ncbi:MAG: DUF4293 family protein [Ferruginibacter sp.]